MISPADIRRAFSGSKCDCLQPSPGCPVQPRPCTAVPHTRCGTYKKGDLDFTRQEINALLHKIERLTCDGTCPWPVIVGSVLVDQSRNGTIAPRETETVTVSIYDTRGRNITHRFTRYSLRRNSGDGPSDRLWNAEHTNVSNPFEIGFDDLGIDGITRVRTIFYVTAYSEDDGDLTITRDYFI